jgi:hypothetical protein
MAGVNYTRLFNTRLEHTFYTGGITKDLQIIPTSETLHSMKDANMMFKNDDTGFRVLYRVDDSNDPFIDFKNVKLVFGVQVKNATEFSNITSLSTIPGYSADKIMYISNMASVTTRNLAITFLDYLKSAIFNYAFPQTGISTDTATISIFKDGADVTPSFPDPSMVKANTAGEFSYPIDFSNKPKGLYEFKTKINPSGSLVTKTVYIDNDLVRQNVFAIMEILAKDGKPANFTSNYPANREYALVFDRREVQWKYIILLKSFDPMALPVIDVFDTNPTQPIYGQINFNTPVNTTINGIPARIITSTASNVPYYEAAKTGLNIRKDPAGTPVTLLTNIPGVPIGITSAQTTPTINFDITEIFVVI